MMNTKAIAIRKVSDVLRPKGGSEVPVDCHVIPARNDYKPDYDAMRRVASGEREEAGEVVLPDVR